MVEGRGRRTFTWESSRTELLARSVRFSTETPALRACCAAEPGLHVMQVSSGHFVENLTGIPHEPRTVTTILQHPLSRLCGTRDATPEGAAR